MNEGVASMRQLNGFFASGLLVPDACRRGAIANPNSAQTRHITPIALSTQKISLLVPDACRRGAIARPNSTQTRHITPIALSTQKIRTFSQFLTYKIHLRMHIRDPYLVLFSSEQKIYVLIKTVKIFIILKLCYRI
jgi:hypothetical protein